MRRGQGTIPDAMMVRAPGWEALCSGIIQISRSSGCGPPHEATLHDVTDMQLSIPI